MLNENVFVNAQKLRFTKTNRQGCVGGARAGICLLSFSLARLSPRHYRKSYIWVIGAERNIRSTSGLVHRDFRKGTYINGCACSSLSIQVT